jgi:iron complex transport system ATP-binding protein
VTTIVPNIAATGLTCRLRDTTLPAGAVDALADVGLRVEAGTLCVIVGPNGAGKTTLLRAMAGLITPTRGEVTVNGRRLAGMPPAERARTIALLPQRPIAPTGITVREAVAWGRAPHVGRFARPNSADLRAVDEALARAGAGHLADRSVDALSGGEHQRAAIARALAQTPSVLLADEPTVHLDLGHQWEIMDLLRDLAREGLVVIAVLHDLNLAAAYADKMIMLHQGRLLAAGLPATVLSPDRIARAYGALVAVDVHPASGRPWIVARRPTDAAVRHGA